MFHRRRERGAWRHGESSLRQRQQCQPLDGDGRQRRGRRLAQSQRQTPAPGVGRIWKSTPADLILRDGRVVARGAPERSLSFTELARLALPGPALKKRHHSRYFRGRFFCHRQAAISLRRACRRRRSGSERPARSKFSIIWSPKMSDGKSIR